MVVIGGHCWSLAVTPKPLQIKGFRSIFQSTPNGIRTRAATLKGWCPRPLDDGGLHCMSPDTSLVVGLPGFEPGTSASRTQRATKLRYSPQRVASQPDNPSRWPVIQTMLRCLTTLLAQGVCGTPPRSR
jgi:hypothetical protein